MGLIDELKAAIDNYETVNCRTEIVGFSITGSGGSYLDVGETFRFRVKVSNDNELDMKNVYVCARGTEYADVRLIPVLPWGATVVLGPFNLDSHQSYTTPFYVEGRAKKATGTAKDIVLARISGWDASFDHLLRDHALSGEVDEGRLNKEIRPN